MNNWFPFLHGNRAWRRDWKRWITVPNIILVIGVFSALMYMFSFLFPFTDNAFVVNNVRPVAAQVNGFITSIHVKNGQVINKEQLLFTIFKKPYHFAVIQLSEEVASAQAKLSALQITYERDVKTTHTRETNYKKQALDDEKYRKGYQMKSVSLITLQNSQQETRAAKDEWEASLKQLEIDKHYITAQEHEIKALTAKLKNAKVNLKLTDVHAQLSGVVQNLFYTIGTPVIANQPLFSLVDNKNIYIQANFNETDLEHVRKGARALIFPRMYLGRKVFHGVVNSDYWSANRQALDHRTQLQNIANENQWILLPQRLPVIIKVLDPNPNYPLRVGSSAYVYIQTN
jgi:multidrug resistance efflux pump